MKITLWIILQIIIGYNLVLPIVLFLFYKLFKKERKKSLHQKDYDYAIIVTAYEQTGLLHSVVGSLLQLNYKNYLIYVVADNCDISELHFNNEKVILLRPDRKSVV